MIDFILEGYVIIGQIIAASALALLVVFCGLFVAYFVNPNEKDKE